MRLPKTEKLAKHSEALRGRYPSPDMAPQLAFLVADTRVAFGSLLTFCSVSAEEISNHSDATNAAVANDGLKRSYPKTHVNYWKVRLEHRTYRRDEITFVVSAWSIRIHFKGFRKSFDLETANREEAAVKARDIYLSLVAKGWSATINELAPQASQPADPFSNSSKVGEFLAEVERTANLKPKTFRCYAQGLRQLAARFFS